MRKNAVDYFGGRDHIEPEWRGLLSEALGSMKAADIMAVERALFPSDPGIARELIDKTRDVTAGMFEKLSCVVGISPASALKFTDDMTEEEEAYWRQKKETAQAFIAGGADRHPELSLELYLLLTALEELEYLEVSGVEAG